MVDLRLLTVGLEGLSYEGAVISRPATDDKKDPSGALCFCVTAESESATVNSV